MVIGICNDNIGINPMIALGVVALAGALMTIPMKETFGVPLADELQENLDKSLDSFASHTPQIN